MPRCCLVLCLAFTLTLAGCGTTRPWVSRPDAEGVGFWDVPPERETWLDRHPGVRVAGVVLLATAAVAGVAFAYGASQAPLLSGFR